MDLVAVRADRPLRDYDLPATVPKCVRDECARKQLVAAPASHDGQPMEPPTTVVTLQQEAFTPSWAPSIPPFAEHPATAAVRTRDIDQLSPRFSKRP